MRNVNQIMLYFCTYFNSNYLIRGLALYHSLVRYVPSFKIWILCFDDITYKTLKKLAFSQVYLISLEEFEQEDQRLLLAKRNRSQIEYYFTCTPFLPLYILTKHPEVDVLSYLDADLFFFENPSQILKELNDNSILIIEHRFPPFLLHLQQFGIYNVGFLSFRRDNEGINCLNLWGEKCLEWCYDRIENGKFADQKYLDDWTINFRRIKVLKHKGANLAPWNLSNYRIWLKNGIVMVDEMPLIFYHFHGLKILNHWILDSGLFPYKVSLTNILKHYIFKPYIQELKSISNELSTIVPDIPVKLGNPRTKISLRRIPEMFLRRTLLFTIGSHIF